MAIANHERIGKALELLNAGVLPYVERELRAQFGDAWIERAQEGLRQERDAAKAAKGAVHWDTHALLAVLWFQWNAVFSQKLGHAERTLVAELREIRNRWAHQERFSSDDAYRALDSVHRLLVAVSAEESIAVDREKQDLLRQRFEEQSRAERRKVAVAGIEGKPEAGFRPWREVVTPHPDVASGRYLKAEFAADLGQVHRGEGSDEYKDPREFFRRTYLTEGLKQLLVGAARRLAGEVADPVVELKTNFGGGKTHSMLALLHAFSGTPHGELLGMEDVLLSAGVSKLPKARIAVLVGTALSPARTHKKPDGTEVRTLWGELAWQLLGKPGYALVKDADVAGVSPGSDALRDIFKQAGPCIVLIDEWVAFVRQLYHVSGLAAGSFDANLTFAQALTEAAKASPETLVVASLPASNIEIGGEGGVEALTRLANTFKRVESAWRPASAEESFEIVRRRLFQPIAEPALHRARDAVARAFVDMYERAPQEFPTECRAGEYERRIIAAYPIHPELFDRLYTDWSSLEKFQRTRGVLRLMAAVIHCLWERGDTNLLILPATVPIDDPAVQRELTHYLEDAWTPVIEKDVDGPNSLPLQLDRENPNLGRYSACRRVARTVYLGSAPTLRSVNKGIEDVRVKLGCTQPGENVATFGDALRRLTDAATHLYVDGRRYWFSTQPSVAQLARDKAERLAPDVVETEIRRRVRMDKDLGDFVKVHGCPEGTGDVPDEVDARLVVLGPDRPHAGRVEDSPARQFVAELLDHRGTTPRIYKNALVFLAADRTRLGDLSQAVRQYLAWSQILEERVTLNLDPFQSKQAETQRDHNEDAVRHRLPETYQWLLVPKQSDPRGAITIDEARLQGGDRLVGRASRRLTSDGTLVTKWAGSLLRLELDRIPLWRDNHVGVRQLVEDFAKYPYLQRLRNPVVLLEALRSGVAPSLSWEIEGFAYADAWDDGNRRYVGLSANAPLAHSVADGRSVVVKVAVALRQIRNDAAISAAAASKVGVDADAADRHAPTATTPPAAGEPPAPKAAARPTRFHATIRLDANRVGRDAGRVAESVIQHLSSIVGARVDVTLEINAEVSSGVPDGTVRVVSENARTLKFDSAEFEG